MEEDSENKESDAAQASPYSMASLQKATGIKLPNLVPKCPTGKFVWNVLGEGPLFLEMRTKNADKFNKPFILSLRPYDEGSLAGDSTSHLSDSRSLLAYIVGLF